MKRLLFLVPLLLVPIFSFSATGVLNSDSGRYVFGQISDTRKDQYLLDTKTGKLWNMLVDEKGNSYLYPVLIKSVVYDKKGNADVVQGNQPR